MQFIASEISADYLLHDGYTCVYVHVSIYFPVYMDIAVDLLEFYVMATSNVTSRQAQLVTVGPQGKVLVIPH